MLCELGEMLSLNPAASMGFVQRYSQIGFRSTKRDGKERDLHLFKLIDRGRGKEWRQQRVSQDPLIKRSHQPLDGRAAANFFVDGFHDYRKILSHTLPVYGEFVRHFDTLAISVPE